jgi:ribosomal protein S18 acetylase RimI-like enzyme
MRQWPNDPTVAHLIFVDHAETPTEDEVARAISHARDRGARAVRTSALFPQATEVVLSLGFEPIDRLALLSRPISARSAPPAGRPTRPMLPWHHPAAAEIDRDAFGPLWGNDAASLRDIRRATPRHRARVVRDGRTIVGFAISGAAGDHGYLQRLAVASTHRRAGHASDLVSDALRWMHGAGLTSVLVNTGVHNTAALALYDRLGFRRLTDELTIAELRIFTIGDPSNPPSSPVSAPDRVPDHREPPATTSR